MRASAKNAANSSSEWKAIAARHLQRDDAIQLGIQGQEHLAEAPELIRFWTR